MTRLALLLFLLAAPAAAQPVCVCLKCITGPYDSYWAPAGAMKPTILPGQCFVVRTEVASSALTPGAIITFRHPVTGEDWFKRIVATAGQTVQMRAGRLFIDGTAIPTANAGHFVEPNAPQGPLRTRPLCANTPVPQGEDCLKARYSETLGGVTYDILDIGASRLDTTAKMTVPKGHLFVLGDNRDNSVDSRIPQNAGGIGYLPIENVTGLLDEIRP